MFVAAVGGVVGVVVIGAVNHSDYSDHYNYSEYGDSSELDEIKKLEDEVNKKEKGTFYLLISPLKHLFTFTTKCIYLCQIFR